MNYEIANYTHTVNQPPTNANVLSQPKILFTVVEAYA